MAKNLRQKLPNHDTLIVQDINKDASRNFADEFSGFPVVVANTARQLAEKSVRHHILYLSLEDEFVLSMI
jgi:3-hydroxyisobutyrate dehydrogenase